MLCITAGVINIATAMWNYKKERYELAMLNLFFAGASIGAGIITILK